MMLNLLAPSSGEDASMEQLAGLIYHTTPMFKVPGQEAEHTDFIMYQFRKASQRPGPVSLRPILEV